MSATSTAGRLIFSCGDTRGWFRSRWILKVGPAGWQLHASGFATDEDTWPLSPGLHVRARSEWCGGRYHLPVSGSPSYGARRSRTAHDLYSAKICYRYHPRYGIAVQLVSYLRRGSAPVVIVRLPDNSQLALPEWMLRPEICEELKIEAKPRISMRALLELCRLAGDQPLAVAVDSRGCAKSATGGQDAQQGERGDTSTQAPLRRR
jgi:hypothetical protein